LSLTSCLVLPETLRRIRLAQRVRAGPAHAAGGACRILQVL